MINTQDLLKQVKPAIFDVLLKVLEYDFWKFQYTSRKFLHDLNNVKDDPGYLRLTGDIPGFKEYVRNQKRFFKEHKVSNEDKIEILEQIGIQQKLIGGWPESTITAFKEAVLANKDTSNRKLKEEYIFSDNPLAIFLQSFLHLSQKYDTTKKIALKIMSKQCSVDDWATSEAVIGLCKELKKRHDLQLAYDDLNHARFISLGHPAAGLYPYSGAEDMAINEIILKVANMYGGYYLTDLFRTLDMNTMVEMLTPFSFADYSEKLKILFEAGSLWQPIYDQDATALLAKRALTSDVPEYMKIYLDIPGYFEYLKPFADVNFFDGSGTSDENVVTIEVAKNKSPVPQERVDLIFTEIKRKVDFEIKRQKTRSKKLHMIKNNELYNENGIKVSVASSRDAHCDFFQANIVIALHIKHKYFSLKTAIDLIKTLYCSYCYLADYGKKYKFEPEISMVPDFQFGQVSRMFGLWIWDKMENGQTRAEAINAVVNFQYDNEHNVFDDSEPIDGSESIDDTGADNRHLNTISNITAQCVEECQVLPMNKSYKKRPRRMEARFDFFNRCKRVPK